MNGCGGKTLNLRGFLKQKVTIERKAGTNPYGETSYSPPEQIPALFQPDDGLIRTSTGQEVQAESSLLTVGRVNLGDLVSGVVTAPDGSTYEVAQAEIRRVTPIVFGPKAIGFKAKL